MRNKLLLYGGTLGAGLASMGLHRYMMDNCFDEKGLLIAGNLPFWLLVAVGGAFAALLIGVLRTIGGDGTYGDAFPRDRLSGVLMILGGVLLAFGASGLGAEQTELPGGAATAVLGVWHQLSGAALGVLPWLAAASMVLMGLCRVWGKGCPVAAGGILCLFYMLMLVNNYRLWSADPQVQDYAYQLLAQVLLMLCAFHRTSCDAGIIQRRKLLITGLGAAVCAMAALSMDFQRIFFLASALWALGCICTVQILPPDPEPQEVSQEEPQEEPRSETEE